MSHARLLACLLAVSLPTALPADTPFAIRVVDDATGRGVPLVELTTVHEVRYVTDSAGFAVIDDPSLQGQKTFFHVKSHGYKFSADGFGYRGKAFQIEPGRVATLELKRANLAERLYRVTGAGIYRDSIRLGREVPVRRPLLNAGVLGSDSVVNAVFRGRVHWFWGDTKLPSYPLGNFHVPGATSRLPADGGLTPDQGVDLKYFLNDKRQAKETCRMEGDGPTWIDGLTVLRDADGKERMFAHYAKIRPPLETYARGLCEFDPDKARFRHVRSLDLESPLRPGGHPVRATDEGEDYIYFARPFPYVRVLATVEGFLDPGRYQAYTCLVQSDDSDLPRVIRDSVGQPVYSWRDDGVPFDENLSRQLLERGLMTEDELVFRIHDTESGDPIRAHRGSLAWNDYRHKWIAIVSEVGGTSLLGEIWYAEAETPLGPWDDAVKIVTHDDYSFYNPKHHPMFDRHDGRSIYFEATYTRQFSGSTTPTPRYDYNQIMYRLDLSLLPDATSPSR